jgi:hypothetical protein
MTVRIPARTRHTQDSAAASGRLVASRIGICANPATRRMRTTMPDHYSKVRGQCVEARERAPHRAALLKQEPDQSCLMRPKGTCGLQAGGHQLASWWEASHRAPAQKTACKHPEVAETFSQD